MRNLSVAALASGGLDSCVMVHELSRQYQEVIPVYIRCGLRWEEEELQALRHFLNSIGDERIQKVQELEFPMQDIYGKSWYTGEKPVPGYHEPDEVWEIPGRNLILISKTAVWCKLHQVDFIALAVLHSNPFPDATADFFSSLEITLRKSLEMEISIIRPFETFHKADIVRMGQSLPLELTLSCANPSGDIHCGVCGKCRERIHAFQEAGISDPTRYAKRFSG